MSSNITLSGAVRQNLVSLQSTTELMSRTQNRLATGLKVNSALDNPNSFFTASGLSARAGDLDTLLEDMGQAIQTLKAADEAIASITELAQAAKAKANQAKTSSDDVERGEYMEEFNKLLVQIENLAEDASYKGINLLAGDSLSVVFNEDGDNKLDITGVDYKDGGADELIADAADWTIANASNVDDDIKNVNDAINTLRSQASTFGTNLTVVESRQRFTKQMINTLEEGAGKLTLADTNEEGANLLTLQTRQSLSSTSLSFAASADQNVLRLF